MLLIKTIYIYLISDNIKCKADNFRCKRMADVALNACKTSLSTLIASDKVQEAENPLQAFSKGPMNFVQHYCLGRGSDSSFSGQVSVKLHHSFSWQTDLPAA